MQGERRERRHRHEIDMLGCMTRRVSTVEDDEVKIKRLDDLDGSDAGEVGAENNASVRVARV